MKSVPTEYEVSNYGLVNNNKTVKRIVSEYTSKSVFMKY
jgi:hypothetical protein